MRYAYRKDDSLLLRVQKIAEGNTNADMIQDLNDIAVMGRENLEPLNAIGFDTSKVGYISAYRRSQNVAARSKQTASTGTF